MIQKCLLRSKKSKRGANLLKKTFANCKNLEKLFQNSATKGKDQANPELKDSKPGTPCSNESVDCRDIISNTSEGDNATPKKDIEAGCSDNGPSLQTCCFQKQCLRKRKDY